MAFFGLPTNGRRQRPFATRFFGFQGGGGVNQSFETMFGGDFFNPQQAGSMETMFADLFDVGPGAAFFQPHEEQEPRQPATAEACLRTMPVVKVTSNDIEEESDECTICLDKLLRGDAALRIPCGHLFHEDCARKWLGNSNQCPVCRYELPTDDVAFEHGRRARMMNRRPRLRVKDLSVKSVKELRHLADHLGVRIQGCLEKHELVDAIVASGRVDIIPVLPPTPSTDSTPLLEPGNSSISRETLALPAIADGEPIIQSFLGGFPSLATLAKTPSVPFTVASKPEAERESPPPLVSPQHHSSNRSANA